MQTNPSYLPTSVGKSLHSRSLQGNRSDDCGESLPCAGRATDSAFFSLVSATLLHAIRLCDFPAPSSPIKITWRLWTTGYVSSLITSFIIGYQLSTPRSSDLSTTGSRSTMLFGSLSCAGASLPCIANFCGKLAVRAWWHQLHFLPVLLLHICPHALCIPGSPHQTRNRRILWYLLSAA